MNKAELINALNKIKPGLSNSSIVELSNHVIFNNDWICSHSGDVWVLYPFQSGIVGAVQDKKLHDLLNKLTEEKIQMVVKDNQLLIRQKHLRAGFPMDFDLSKVPEEVLSAKIAEKDWIKLPDNFIESIQFCMFSVATDVSLGSLISLKIKEDRIYSCDNYRATVYKLDSLMPDELLIPLDIAKHLINFSMDRYCKKENLIHFSNEEKMIFVYREVGEEEYPDIDHLFQVEGTAVQLPKESKNSLIRSEIFSNSCQEEDNPVEIVLSNGKLECKKEAGDGSWIIEDNEISYNGKEIQIKVVPKYLYQILDKMSSLIIGSNSILFECEKFKYVMALME